MTLRGRSTATSVRSDARLLLEVPAVVDRDPRVGLEAADPVVAAPRPGRAAGGTRSDSSPIMAARLERNENIRQRPRRRRAALSVGRHGKSFPGAAFFAGSAKAD